jgi:hypothetical protein
MVSVKRRVFSLTEEMERRGRMVRTSDSQPEARGFESRRRHGVVVGSNPGEGTAWYL